MKYTSIALLLLAGPLSAQSAPPARAHHVVYYDEARERVMVVNGTASVGGRNYRLLNDLWAFDGTSWTALAPSGDERSGNRVALDAAKQVFSFGGWSDTSFGDLRRLDARGWQVIGEHPSVRTAEGGFVFDAARSRFIAFGGGGNSRALLGEVWEYAQSKWNRHAAPAPPARGSHVMVYDERRRKTVVFGGMGVRVGNADTPMLGDTWEFDGTAWKRFDVTGPSPRLGAGAAYDSKRGLVLVFGGASDGRAHNDLWSWDGTTWKKLAENGPEPRVMGYIAYDKKRDRVVLFGGRRDTPDNADLGDTWEWDGSAWHRR
jgi:hypothetical protein